MKILLVRPYPELRVAQCVEKGFLCLEPLNLEIVAGGIPADDEVEILDLSLHQEPVRVFEEALRQDPPDLIGYSGYSTHARQIKRLAKVAKQHRQEVINVVGGIHATILPRDYATDHIDVIVRGEGGTAMRELLERLKAGQPPAFGSQALNPRSPDFAERCDEPPPPYPSFEEIPSPRRDLVDRSRYFCVWTSSRTDRLRTMFPRVATVRTSVGCAYRCSFCVVPHLMSGKYVQRTPEDVVDEIESLSEENIYFLDDEMFLNPKRVERIAELLIERNVQKVYYSWARSDTIVKHPELFSLWKRAGLGTVYVGLESMSDGELNGYEKETGSDVNMKAVEILREIDLCLHGCFIVNPDYTVEDFRALERETRRLSPAEITFTVLSPSPGTEYWRQHEGNFICDSFYYYDCMHSVLPTRLPLKRFYAHFSRLYRIALTANPLRVKRVRVPFKELVRAIVMGTKFILALKAIYKDYAGNEHRQDNSR